MAALLVLPGLARACPGPDGITALSMTGTWDVGEGSANVNQAPMMGGDDRLVLSGSGDGLTLLIDDRRVSLSRVRGAAPGWNWEADPRKGVAMTASDAALFFNCELEQMSRWAGEFVVDGMAVTFRVMAVTPSQGAIYWTMTGTGINAKGLFPITK